MGLSRLLYLTMWLNEYSRSPSQGGFVRAARRRDTDYQGIRRTAFATRKLVVGPGLDGRTAGPSDSCFARSLLRSLALAPSNQFVLEIFPGSHPSRNEGPSLREGVVVGPGLDGRTAGPSDSCFARSLLRSLALAPSNQFVLEIFPGSHPSRNEGPSLREGVVVGPGLDGRTAGPSDSC